MKIAFYGSSILSSYWNGAATYYRGLLKSLAALGHDITFYEPDAYDRQSNRDMEPPEWCRVIVYPATFAAVREVTAQAAQADVVVKASGVGVFDEELLLLAMAAARPEALRVWWDVDAPATLAELEQNPEAPLRRLLPQLDAVLTYGGGDSVVRSYEALGARHCEPIYNALDPDTHHPVSKDPRYQADLSFLGNRLPDREARVESFFLSAAEAAPQLSFLLGGSGWEGKSLPRNVRALGHVPTAEHNAFNCSPRAVLNINRTSMAERGFSPATRVFEAAGAGGCLITDAWEGIDSFLQPEREVLVIHSGRDLLERLGALGPEQAAAIGEAARQRLLRDHTYRQRAEQLDAILQRRFR
ncbi:MAG TPA: glycosyltransferase [Kiloniellales bacterium]|nr:glycosyltransferase [Kiloniellales bacterium]